MDDKGRVSVPAEFRARLGRVRRLMLTQNLDAAECVIAFPVRAWEELYGQVAARARWDDAIVRLKRALVGGSHECAIDPQGRLLVPPALRAHAGLRGDVVWVGVGEEIELWDAARWQAEQKRNKDDRAVLVRPLVDPPPGAGAGAGTGAGGGGR